MRSVLVVALGGAVVFPTTIRHAAAQAYGTYLQVSRSESGFTVEAEEATLPQVLTALGRKAGFAVQDSAAERTPIPAFQVRDASLETTLRRLLESSNHLIVYRGGSHRRIEEGNIEKIVLLSPGKREPAPKSPVSSLAGPGAVAPSPAPRVRPETAPAPPAAAEAYGEPPEAQLEYGENLQEMEYEQIEQLDVDPDVASGEPGVDPPMPPGVLRDLEAAAYAGAEDGLPAPEVVAPLD